MPHSPQRKPPLPTLILPTALASLSPKRLELALTREKLLRIERQKFKTYYPETGPLRRELYPKHMAFFAAGATFRQRAAIAGNRVGKSEGIGGYELTLHLTGRYPEWWTGRRFSRPVKAWACGETSKTVREIVQQKLFGPVNKIGTGLIPFDAIVRKTPQHGIPDAIETAEVAHVSGGVSRVVLKSYEQGREAFEGDEQDVIWLDEKYPIDIYTECLTRTMTTRGIIICTFTPTDGLTEGVLQFMPAGQMPKDGIHFVVQIGWDEVPHLTEQAKAELRASYPAHELKARTLGIPQLGSGAVFGSVEEKSISWEAKPIPAHWPRLCCMDFGWDHPTAAAWLAWDLDTDTIYVYDAHRASHTLPAVHASTVRTRGAWIPVAWPKDILQTEKGTGEQLAELYRKEGLNMLPEHARFEETGTPTESETSRVSVEAGLMEMLQRMQSGRFKVAAHLGDFWEEFRLYHRKNGKLIKVGEDLISAVRYGVMMLRFAITEPRPKVLRRAVAADSWRT